jgi:ectoine hydroxylase-related dioxygenase (phytanoyl-CoA dioxygenase family)
MKKLDQDTIEQFYHKGHVVLPELFNSQEIAPLIEAAEEVFQLANQLAQSCDHQGARIVFDKGHLQRVVWCGALSETLLKVSEDPRITTAASQILASETIVQLINQLHFKMPGDNIYFPLHQDAVHRRYGTDEWTDVNGKGSYLQTVLTLDEMTAENGPLLFLPYSADQGIRDLEQEPLRKDEKLETITAPPGSLVLFGPYTIHGSQANTSDKARRVLINGYAYPGANQRVYPGCGKGRELYIPK